MPGESPNSTGRALPEPLPCSLVQQNPLHSHKINKEQNSSWRDQPLFSPQLGKSPLCRGEFRTIQPRVRSSLCSDAQKHTRKFAFYLWEQQPDFSSDFCKSLKERGFHGFRKATLKAAPSLDSPISLETQLLITNHRYLDLGVFFFLESPGSLPAPEQIP